MKVMFELGDLIVGAKDLKQLPPIGYKMTIQTVQKSEHVEAGQTIAFVVGASKPPTYFIPHDDKPFVVIPISQPEIIEDEELGD